MRIAITGATGLIGTSLLQFWSDRTDISVTALTRTLSFSSSVLKSLIGINWQQGDLNSSADCEALVRDQDVVVHLAHTNAPLTCDRDMSCDTQLNLIPTLRLLKAIQDADGQTHLIYPSSGGAIYGRSLDRTPFTEAHPCSPVNSYGIQKLASEHYIRLCAERGGVTADVLRISNVYGWLVSPARKQGFIGTALFQALGGHPLRIIGDPDNIRDYIHIHDVCRAVDACLSPRESFHILNIGANTGHSVLQVVELMETILGRPLDRRTENWEEGKHLPDWCVLDNSMARRQLMWHPRIDLESGIREMLASAPGPSEHRCS